ncbi:hypothetical protein [Streptomyces sp. NPDC051569]|uniref:hypothetical protein n=1 Tax=Streptomyces sp. NPDC051569 TaxID=3365661 RepID=UPI0037977071
MAGQRRTASGPRGSARRRTAAGWLAALLLASACTAPAKAPAADTAAGDIRRTLDRWAAAVLDRDEQAYLAVLDPSAAAPRVTERAAFENLAEVPLSSWTYRVTDIERPGSGHRARVRAELRYRIEGYDSAPVPVPRTLELAERAGRWYVTADRPGEGGGEQLWEQGRVRVVRGARSLVLGVGQDTERLRGIAADADLAVPAVDGAWPGPWGRRVVVLVPGSLDALGKLLGAPAGGYRGIAALTTGGAGGPGAAPADRIIVNPDAYATLGAFGQQVVLTHETTHVATRAATSAATPDWLSEGFADRAAYRSTGRDAGDIAPELQRAVRRGEVPAALPADEDFAFSGDADRLARAYEGGWLACELIASRWGERRLTDFYRAVGVHGERPGAVEDAMNDVLATTPEAFTARWRTYLVERLG